MRSGFVWAWGISRFFSCCVHLAWKKGGKYKYISAQLSAELQSRRSCALCVCIMHVHARVMCPEKSSSQVYPEQNDILLYKNRVGEAPIACYQSAAKYPSPDFFPPITNVGAVLDPQLAPSPLAGYTNASKRWQAKILHGKASLWTTPGHARGEDPRI